MKIILIGFMGCGKSTVAKKLSGILKWPLLEMDDLVLQKRHTKNMQEVFAQGGEGLLRETELAIAQQYEMRYPTIISTGGGVGVNNIVLDYLKKPEGKIFFLKATFQTIATRLGEKSDRPLFKNHVEAHSLYRKRQPLYLKNADAVIEVDQKSIEEITYEIAENVRRMCGKQ